MKVSIFHQNEEILTSTDEEIKSSSEELIINDNSAVNIPPPKIKQKKFVELINNENQAKAKIDEWLQIINDPNIDSVFYLDTEVGGFKTASERLSCIQCLVVSRPRVNDQILRLFNPTIVPPSISCLLEEKKEIIAKHEDNVEEEQNMDKFIDNKVIQEIEKILIRDALPNGKIVLLDVLNMSDNIVDYFVENIMFDERCEKVFHYKTFDLKFLGGAYCKNVSCTHEISSKYIPYHLLPIPNFKLDTLSQYLTGRIISHINNLAQTLNNDVGNLEEIKELLTYANKKELQESDWFNRPLSPTQVEYATQDVITLFGVHQLLISILVFQDNSFHLQSYFKYLYSARSADSEDSPQDVEEEDNKNEYLLPLEYSDTSKDITNIEDSIKDIEDEFQLLESKMSTLQDRIKQVMIRENVNDTRFFKLSSSKRTTQQIPLHLLVEHVANQRSTTRVKVNPINLPIGVTTTMKKALKEAGFADIPTQSIIKQESSSYRITKK